MSCLYKIREGFPTFTGTDKKLAQYILDNKDIVVNESAQILGEKVSASPAAVIRFSKKLGYKGFTAMKVDLAKDNSDDDYDFDELINSDDTYEVLVRKSYISNFKTLEQTYKLINANLIAQAVNLLIDARHIYLLGVGGSGIVCDDFVYKLTRINRMAIRYNDPHLMLPSIANMSEKDVAIAISYAGQTREVNIAMEYAKKHGAKTIAITSFSKNTLAKIADVVLHIPSEEKEIRMGAISSRSSSLIITDLLYYGVAKVDMEDTKNKIIQTRDIIKKLK